MRVLAIETASTLGGVAVMDSTAGLLAESRLNVKAVSHSERLMAEVDAVLGRCGLTLGDIDALVSSVGPGSFTGLRIGIATVKGIAFATGARVVGVSSLEALAWGAGGPLVCPTFDARRKEVYAGVFRVLTGGLERVIGEAAYAPEALALKLAGLDEPVVLAGEGALIYRAVFESALGGSAIYAPPHRMVPSPSALAHLGLMRAMAGEYTDGERLAPAYIRKSEAELRLGE